MASSCWRSSRCTCRSAWQERRSELEPPSPGEPQLCWFVREAWPSPVTGTRYTEGVLRAGETLTLTSQTDGLVIFGDGIEPDRLAAIAHLGRTLPP
jgi:hypothetical protein